MYIRLHAIGSKTDAYLELVVKICLKEVVEGQAVTPLLSWPYGRVKRKVSLLKLARSSVTQMVSNGERENVRPQQICAKILLMPKAYSNQVWRETQIWCTGGLTQPARIPPQLCTSLEVVVTVLTTFTNLEAGMVSARS